MTGATLAILAGGRGQRMGRPKGELKLRHKPILTYLLERFGWPGPTMLVTSPGREKPPGAEGFDREVVDPVEGMGPLRGVMTAIENCETALLVVTSVDMPGIGGEQLEWLVERLEDAAGVMMRRGNEIEPLPVTLRVARARRACHEEMQITGSIRALAKQQGFLAVEAPANWGQEVWTNLNEPGDLIAFEQQLKRQ
jgi:molybdopterin-guanine dinucleotide biosynthesis protein A